MISLMNQLQHQLPPIHAGYHVQPMTIALLVALSPVGHVTPCTALWAMGLVTTTIRQHQRLRQLHTTRMPECVENVAEQMTTANKAASTPVPSAVTFQVQGCTVRATSQACAEETKKT